MGLETFNFIDSLVTTNPVGATDPKSQGDDHLRGIKTVLKNTFPNLTGAMTLTQAQLNNLADAAIKDEANVFTGASNTFEGTAPEVRIRETDGTADNKNWNWLASGEDLYLRAYNDAWTASSNAIRIARTGTVVDSFELRATDVKLLGGTNLEMSGATATKTLRITTSDALSTLTTTDTHLDVNLAGGVGNLRLKGGSDLQVFDSTGADSITIKHDGVNPIFSVLGASYWDFQSVALRLNGNDPSIYQYLPTNGVNNKVWRTFVESDGDWALGTYTDAFAFGEYSIRVARSGTDTTNIIFTANAYQFLGSSVDNGLYMASCRVSTDNNHPEEVGFRGLPTVVQNGNYTLVLDDCGRTIKKSSGSGNTITIPANASVNFPTGAVVVIWNRSAFSVSIAITTDSLIEWGTGNTGTRTLAADGKAVLEKVLSTEWRISGIGLT